MKSKAQRMAAPYRKIVRSRANATGRKGEFRVLNLKLECKAISRCYHTIMSLNLRFLVLVPSIIGK